MTTCFKPLSWYRWRVNKNSEIEELGAPFSPKQQGILAGRFGLEGTPISATSTTHNSAGKNGNGLIYTYSL